MGSPMRRRPSSAGIIQFRDMDIGMASTGFSFESWKGRDGVSLFAEIKASSSGVSAVGAGVVISLDVNKGSSLSSF